MQIALTDSVLWMQMNEPALLNTCHSVQVSRILKWRVARSYQADVLLKVSQHSAHHIHYITAAWHQPI